MVYIDQGKLDQSEALLSRATSIFTHLKDEEKNDENMVALATAYHNLALINLRNKYFSHAEEFVGAALLVRSKIQSERHPGYIGELRFYAEILRTEKRTADAVHIERRANLLERGRR
jgi:hypothetical protein